MNIRILAKSSSDDPYQVNFVIEGGKLTVSCNCRAGIFGNLCKHKTELLAGKQSRLFDESETLKLEQLKTIVSRAHDLGGIAQEIADSEIIIRKEQSKLKKTKKNFADKLKSGVSIVDP